VKGKPANVFSSKKTSKTQKHGQKTANITFLHRQLYKGLFQHLDVMVYCILQPEKLFYYLSFCFFIFD